MSYKDSIFTTGNVVYNDIDFSFKLSPSSNDIRIKTDLDAVKQQLKNILFTARGEKPFQPEFDIGINELLFEPFDDITGDVMRDRIQTAIENYIKRIELLELDVDANADMNEMNISIKFNMVNVLQPQTIEIIVQRKR